MERFVLHSREKDTLDAQAALKRLTMCGDYTTADAYQKQVAIAAPSLLSPPPTSPP